VYISIANDGAVNAMLPMPTSLLRERAYVVHTDHTLSLNWNHRMYLPSWICRSACK